MKGKRFSFPTSARLNHPREFTHVFETATVRRRHGALRITAVENRMHSARLGLVVGKRAVPRAVDRNRARRVLREYFRLHRHELPAMDIIIQVTGKADNDAYRESLQALFARLGRSEDRSAQPPERIG